MKFHKLTFKIFLVFILSFAILFSSCKDNKTTARLSEVSIEKPIAPFTLVKDVLWASPKGFDLTMDIYTPTTGKESYPVIVMFHGGGWLINNNSIMNQSSKYLATNGEYVICNVNYRLLGDLDNTTTVNEIVEDAFGAVLWVKNNIAPYKGNPNKIIVTGDSAGGHLATMVVTQGDQLSSSGFKGENLGYNPTWLPEGKTAEDIAKENGLAVQAGLISYGAFDLYNAAKNGFESKDNFFWQMGNAEARGIFGNDYNYIDNPELYKKVSPIYNITSAEEKPLPPLLFTVGSEDMTTTPASIEAYINKLKEAGYTALEYWVHEDRPHAFLDSGSNEFLKINFEDDAPPALDKILDFFNKIFY